MQDNDVAGAKLPGGHSRGTIIQAIPAQHGSAFHLLPKRWVIERTFAWLGRNRRLAKDLETLVETRGGTFLSFPQLLHLGGCADA